MRVTLIVLLSTAACEPRPGLAVRATGRVLEFQFANCQDQDVELPLHDLRVTREGVGEVCRLVHEPGGPWIVRGWRYPEAVAGYDMAGCHALAPGAYVAVAALASFEARVRFRILADGRVETSSRGPCER